MESEKVKEIKESLDNCTNHYGTDCYHCPYLEKGCNIKLMEASLTLINELESENKELNNELKRYKMDWLNSEKMHLQADMEDTEFELFCANKSLNEVRAENNELKDRIAELEKENESIKKQLIAIDALDETNFEKRHNAIVFITEKQLKQFAERLKEKFNRQEERFATDVTRFENDLDKVKESDLPTAKFLIGKATGQATMAEKAEYYIDETLKEFLK